MFATLVFIAVARLDYLHGVNAHRQVDMPLITESLVQRSRHPIRVTYAVWVAGANTLDVLVPKHLADFG